MRTSQWSMAALTAMAVAAVSISVLPLPSAADHAAAPHWSYSGDTGPTHWSTMDPAFSACATGATQSPIDLVSSTAKAGKAGEFHIDYEKGTVSVVNNGHTEQANVSDPKDTVAFDGDTYRLAQFHFHTPSEHTTDGKRFPLEIHFVNQNDRKKIVVVGVLVELGKKNDSLAALFSHLPASGEKAATESKPSVSVDLASVLPRNHEAYVYSGSLTTPPCSEGVRWIVLSHPIQMSQDQIHSFSKIFPDNHRPLQKANGREVDDETE
ncbi:carbonic anhydrase [Dyella soli]|uniref:carbonic anhydrase n=1 Tax=Dyella soli TaxID=522319 RepID=A0A4R0YQV1_9GAMM|nr:carbonic anhydrase family protein [Dyella soli]TCI11216.1 carbonic anhydrase family protein [Dyella soli]